MEQTEILTRIDASEAALQGMFEEPDSLEVHAVKTEVDKLVALTREAARRKLTGFEAGVSTVLMMCMSRLPRQMSSDQLACNDLLWNAVKEVPEGPPRFDMTHEEMDEVAANVVAAIRENQAIVGEYLSDLKPAVFDGLRDISPEDPYELRERIRVIMGSFKDTRQLPSDRQYANAHQLLIGTRVAGDDIPDTEPDYEAAVWLHEHGYITRTQFDMYYFD